MRALAACIALLVAAAPAPANLPAGSGVGGHANAAPRWRTVADPSGRFGFSPTGTARAGTQPQRAPQRIISLIPAVTEMLFAIGAGPQIVAVSSFDRYPPEVEKLQRVGALIDPDVERILSLRPDLVAIFSSQTDLRAQLERARIPLFLYTDAGLADVANTMRTLGTRVGKEAAGNRAAGQLEASIAAVRARVTGRARPRTLIVFDREPFTLRGIYASGGIGFIHDMVEAAGGTNVFRELQRKAVQATTEQILTRAPDVILELRADALPPDEKRREMAAWQALPALPAVRAGRVYIIADPRTVLPGPRIAQAIELIARTLHADAFR
jgi:iron complex transport system substrate-binding protein